MDDLLYIKNLDEINEINEDYENDQREAMRLLNGLDDFSLNDIEFFYLDETSEYNSIA